MVRECKRRFTQCKPERASWMWETPTPMSRRGERPVCATVPIRSLGSVRKRFQAVSPDPIVDRHSDAAAGLDP
jgi:hypothetical protein